MKRIFINLEHAAAFTGHRIAPYGKQRDIELKLIRLRLHKPSSESI